MMRGLMLLAIVLPALLTAAPSHAEEVERAARVCDVEALNQELARLRDELARRQWEPEEARRVSWELAEVRRALRWCPRAT